MHRKSTVVPDTSMWEVSVCLRFVDTHALITYTVTRILGSPHLPVMSQTLLISELTHEASQVYSPWFL